MESNLNVEVGAFQLQGDFTRLQRWRRITTHIHAHRHARRGGGRRRGKVVKEEETGDGEEETVRVKDTKRWIMESE